jgi:DNA-binding transcriptional LysR family regulator
MLDLQQIESFRMVARTHNFTRAAAELGYSQSSVTLHVKALERELGTALLERHRFSKTVELTEAGRRTLDYAERLLALADETKAAAKR